jgi:hypothetical protein
MCNSKLAKLLDSFYHDGALIDFIRDESSLRIKV